MNEQATAHAQLRTVAMQAAQAGGLAAMAWYRRSDLRVEWKADESPVTLADRQAEEACKQVILAAYPQDAWLGEESGEQQRSDAQRRWIVDPIDGTRNFVRGIPLWSTLVACEERQDDGSWRIVASAVNLPALDERYDAFLGGGARLNGATIHVSNATALDHALFCYETPAWFIQHGLGEVFTALCAISGLQRGGGDAFYHMLVASGRAEIVVEPKLAVWDVAATSLIVEEAGGRFSDLRGVHDIRAGQAVITNGHMHAAVLDLIANLRGDGG
jgi:histidinol-phosphatase